MQGSTSYPPKVDNGMHLHTINKYLPQMYLFYFIK